MIYINNEKIDVQGALNYSGSDPLLLFIKAEVKKIKAGPQIYRFKYRDGIIKRNKLQGLPEGKKTVISWEDPVSSSRGTEHWVWATSRVKLPNGTYRYSPNADSSPFTKELSLDRDIYLERILFLLCASSRIRTGLIILENLEAEAQARLTGSADKEEVKIAVVRMPINRLKKIASAFNIENASNLSEFVLRETLLNRFTVLVSEGRKSYQEILDIVKSDDQATLRANIQLALDAGILVYQNGQYGFANEKGVIADPIIQVPTKREYQKEDILVAFLEENVAAYKRIVNEIAAVKSVDNIGHTQVDPIIPIPPIETGAAGDATTATAPPPGAQVVENEILEGIRTFVMEHVALPFTVEQKDKIKEVAALAGIEGAKPGRNYSLIYEEIKKFFNLE